MFAFFVTHAGNTAAYHHHDGKMKGVAPSSHQVYKRTTSMTKRHFYSSCSELSCLYHSVKHAIENDPFYHSSVGRNPIDEAVTGKSSYQSPTRFVEGYYPSRFTALLAPA